jgi:uncharacterized protein YbbC (DUF1343 family)
MRKIASFLSLAVVILTFVGCSSQQNDTQSGDTSALKTGAELLVANNFDILKGKNVGVVTNHSAVVGGKHLVDLLHESEDVNVVVLFGPEHGIRGDDVGIIADATDEKTGLPVYSLYGDIRKPTAEMLSGVDVLVFDIQDIGPRFYTYITTMGLSMQAAAEHGVSFVVLDRPNPIGGYLIEGFVRDEDQYSFVGPFRIPVTHGMTVGEIANMVKAEGMMEGLENLDLTVLAMQGWDRTKLWPEYNLGWIKPSPNIPDFETALIYPGACFFEGLTASEGRGTQEPFILLGAPWIDAQALVDDLNSRNLPGLRFEPATFTPVPLTGMTRNPKFNGQEIYGARYVVTDSYAVRPVEAGIHMVHAFYKHTPEANKATFFRTEVMTRLAGTPRLQNMITDGKTAEEIIASWQDELNAFSTVRQKHLLY